MELTTERQERRIRIVTRYGSIEGSLLVSPMLRTLDELNIVAQDFVNLHRLRLQDGVEHRVREIIGREEHTRVFAQHALDACLRQVLTVLHALLIGVQAQRFRGVG